MIKSIKPRGAKTPVYKPITMPILIDYRSRRIKTIVKHCTKTKEFDAEVNAAISDGWTLDDVRPTSSESMIMLFALLHKFEQEEQNNV